MSNGGASSYYDVPVEVVTLNDILEWKGESQWKGDSFHLSNIVKAAWRWGIKPGVTEVYDIRKIIYSGARLLMKYQGVHSLRVYLWELLNDPQFKEKE